MNQACLEPYQENIGRRFCYACSVPTLWANIMTVRIPPSRFGLSFCEQYKTHTTQRSKAKNAIEVVFIYTGV